MSVARLIDIDVDQLEPDPENVRTAYDPEVIRGLAAFFKDQGTFIENPVVWKAGKLPDGRPLYRAFSGSTRAQAARSVGGKITVQVLPEAPRGSGKVLGQLAASLVKGELSAIDISRSLNELQQEGQRSVQDLVRELADWGIRRSRSWVFQHLHLAQLVPPLQDMVRAGQVPIAAVNALYNKPPHEQLRLARGIAEGSLRLADIDGSAGPAEAIQHDLDEAIREAASPRSDRSRGRRTAPAAHRHGDVQTRRLLMGVDRPDELARMARLRRSQAGQHPPKAWAEQATDEERALAAEALHLGRLDPGQAIEAANQWQREAEIAPDEVLMAAHGMKRLIDAYTRAPDSLSAYPGLMSLLQLRASALTEVAQLVKKRARR